MKRVYILFTIITLQLSGCKQAKLDYKYSDKEDLVKCSSGGDMELIKEAVYAFEDYITKHYAFIGNTTAEGYHNYLKLLFNNRAPAKEYFSEHLMEIVQILKAEDDLWVINGSKVRLNYNNELVNCILQKIQDKDISSTLDVLITSKTLSTEVLAPTLYNKKQLMAKDDRALATYVALDMFYTKLIQMSSPDYVEKSKKNKGVGDLDINNLKRVDVNLKSSKQRIKKDSLEINAKNANNK